MIDLFASARYQMAADADGFDGGVIFASSVSLHTLSRRQFQKYPHLERRILDPQLYLSGLDASTAADTCARLASYGWFDASAPQFDSSEQTQKEWKGSVASAVAETWTRKVPTDSKTIEDRVRLCIEVQQRLGCEAFVLPSPLTTDGSTDFSAELEWLDAGLDLARRIDPETPRLATIAISDTCLLGTDPWSSRMLETLVDQVSAREPEGAYIVIEQASNDHVYEAHSNTLGALARLVRDLRAGGVSKVIVPLAGVAGMLGVALGAEIWSTHWYRGWRRVRLADMDDSKEGRAVPTYYSHALAGEIHLKNDLDQINEAGLLDLVADETPYSQGLLRALRRRGGVVASVPEWLPRPANVSAARGHFASACVRETASMRALPVARRLGEAKRWLDRAVKVASRLSSIEDDDFGFHPRTSLGHQRAWRAVLDAASN